MRSVTMVFIGALVAIVVVVHAWAQSPWQVARTSTPKGLPVACDLKAANVSLGIQRFGKSARYVLNVVVNQDLAQAASVDVSLLGGGQDQQHQFVLPVKSHRYRAGTYLLVGFPSEPEWNHLMQGIRGGAARYLALSIGPTTTPIPLSGFPEAMRDFQRCVQESHVAAPT